MFLESTLEDALDSTGERSLLHDTCSCDFDVSATLAHFGSVNTIMKVSFFGLCAASLMFATPASAEPPANYEIIPKKLIASISASSQSDGSDAKRVRDGKASTAWVAGKGEGVGTTLAIAYTSPRHIAWVTLVTGHGTDTTKNATVARPTKVTLLWEGGEQAFTLADTRSPQDLALRGFARMSTLTLRVDEVSGPEGASVAAHLTRECQGAHLHIARPDARRRRHRLLHSFPT